MPPTLQTRLGLVFATVLASLFLVLAAMTGGYLFSRQEDALVRSDEAPALAASHVLRNTTDQMLDDEFIYLKDAQARPRTLHSFEQHRQEFQQSLKQAFTLGPSPRERRELNLIESQFKRLLDAHQRTQMLVETGRLEQARAEHRLSSGLGFANLRTHVERLHDINIQDLTDLREAAQNREDQVLMFAILVTAAGTVLAAFLWQHVSREIVGPLEHLQDAARQLAHGRFIKAQHPRAERTRELASLQADFNAMSTRLEAGATQLRQSNSTLEQQVHERTQALCVANNELERLIAELRTLDRMKSDFMAMMSHELLTPINFIMGFGSSLEDGLLGPLSPPQLEAIGKMMGGADRLTRMVRNTIEYTLLDAGSLELNLGTVDLSALIQRAVKDASPTFAAREQRVLLDLSPEAPPAWGDAERIHQILGELLDNASKFSLPGRDVNVTLQCDPETLWVTVQDHGQGIAEVALPQLFEPFYQADLSRTRAQGGMGLGLAIAYSLVLKQGGTMMVSSKPDQGTCICFSLPLATKFTQAPSRGMTAGRPHLV